MGLRSFHKEEAGIFYGRNDEILDAIDKLNGMASSENQKFLNIIGASGVGKSSFLKAGILPLLELLHQDDWYVLPTFRAKQELLLNLGRTFSFANGSVEALSQANTKTFFDAMEEQIYKECKSQNRKIAELKILFPIDQAEEILSSTNSQKNEQFFKILETLLEEKSNFFVVWTLRSDHLKKYQDEALLEFLHQQDETLLLQPIASKELKNIIQEPAYTADVHIEEAVVEEIKEDIRSSTSLPLLAHLLQTLYSKTKSKEKKQITLNDYKALSCEGRNPIENIINEQAENIYKNIKDESLVQELFLNHLIKVNSDESVIKQSANLNAIPLKQQEIAEQFVAKRLFVKDGDGWEVATIEIAHEALISSWERLVNWIEVEKEFLLFRNHLELLYREWRESNEDERALLKDLNLEKALSFKSKLVREEEIGFVELSFENEEKQRRNRRNFLLGVGGVISSLGAFSAFKWVEADKAKTIATKKTLEVEQEILKPKNMLYDATMERGFIYRDYQQKALEAKHTFARALGQSSNSLQEKYSSIAYKNMNDGLKLQNIFKYGKSIKGVEVSKDKKEILSWSKNGIIQLWNRKSKKPLLILKHNAEVNGVIFSKYEQKILSWSSDGTIKLWNKTSNKPLFVLRHEDSVYGIELNKDETELLSWSRDKTVKLWNNTSDKPLLTLKHDSSVNGAKFSQDETKIFTWSGHLVKLWNKKSETPLLILKHNSVVSGIKFNKKGTEILSWSSDGTIQLWGRNNNPLLILKHDAYIVGARFNKNETQILSWDSEGNIILWNRNSHKAQFTLKHYNLVFGARFNKNETQILSWDSEGNIVLWDSNTHKALFTLKHNSSVTRVEFNKNETQILSLSSKGILKLWNITSNNPLLILKHNNCINGIRFSQSQKEILSWSSDGSIKLWNIKSNKSIITLKHSKEVWGTRFNRNETKILSWSWDGTIKLWNKLNGKVILVLRHNGWIYGANFNKDETKILSWSRNGTIKVWDKINNKLLVILKHDDLVNGAKFTQKGEEILALLHLPWVHKHLKIGIS